MQLKVGGKYNYWYRRNWIYDGLFDGDYPCDECMKKRSRLHWFHAGDNKDDVLKLGTECVKNDMRIDQ